jgi:mRNA interferase HigB
MQVIGRTDIEKFLSKHPELRREVSELFRDVERKSFHSMEDFRAQYPSIKVIDGRTVVFKVRGNKYRLSARVAFRPPVLRVIALETHAQYDRRELR